MGECTDVAQAALGGIASGLGLPRINPELPKIAAPCRGLRQLAQPLHDGPARTKDLLADFDVLRCRLKLVTSRGGALIGAVATMEEGPLLVGMVDHQIVTPRIPFPRGGLLGGLFVGHTGMRGFVLSPTSLFFAVMGSHDAIVFSILDSRVGILRGSDKSEPQPKAEDNEENK